MEAASIPAPPSSPRLFAGRGPAGDVAGGGGEGDAFGRAVPPRGPQKPPRGQGPARRAARRPAPQRMLRIRQTSSLGGFRVATSVTLWPLSPVAVTTAR